MGWGPRLNKKKVKSEVQAFTSPLSDCECGTPVLRPHLLHHNEPYSQTRSQSLFDNNSKTSVNIDSFPFENFEQRNDVIEYILKESLQFQYEGEKK